MLRHERLRCNNSITQDASTSALLHARQDERHGVSGLIKVYCVRTHMRSWAICPSNVHVVVTEKSRAGMRKP